MTTKCKVLKLTVKEQRDLLAALCRARFRVCMLKDVASSDGKDELEAELARYTALERKIQD